MPPSLAHTSPTGTSGYGWGCPGHGGGWADGAQEHNPLTSGTRARFGERNLETEAEGGLH